MSWFTSDLAPAEREVMARERERGTWLVPFRFRTPEESLASSRKHAEKVRLEKLKASQSSLEGDK